MLTINHIKALNIEVSSKCIGKCPFCSRDQKIRPYGNYAITLKDFKKLPEELIRHLNWISFAGNFGDLSTNPEMVDIAGYIKHLNESVVLGGDTNGSVQKESWWADLGKYFDNGSMVFSLDGLEDTHAIHRVGTDFNKILRNVEAFCRAGGVAHWKFILFEHNEHQIKAARETAQKIGCRRFFVISSRDYDNKLRPPQKKQFQVKREIFQEYDEKLASSDAVVTCKPLANGSLYLAADGTVHPCCFAHCMYVTEHNQLFDFIPGLAEKYYDRINFKTRSLEEILKGEYFESILKQSKSNAYCRMKCNQFRKKIKKELILEDTYF